MAIWQRTILAPPRHISITSSYLAHYYITQIGECQPTWDDLNPRGQTPFAIGSKCF